MDHRGARTYPSTTSHLEGGRDRAFWDQANRCSCPFVRFSQKNVKPFFHGVNKGKTPETPLSTDDEDELNKILGPIRALLPGADPIEKHLDLTPMPVQEIVIAPREDGNDYETAREGVHRLAGKAETALNELLQIARISQHPRAYEVAGQLIEKASSCYDKLLAFKEKHGQPGDGAKDITSTSVEVFRIARDGNK
jgi:hypothetical protein